MPQSAESSRSARRGVLARRRSDEELAAAVAAGDDAAFAEIYARHHQALYRYCRAILHDEQEARDALQNTMLKAYSGVGSRRRKAPVRPWLFRVARNESVNLLRARRRHEDVAEHEVEGGQGTDEEAARRARLRELVADLGRLPERQRSALVMRELSGLEYAEIGASFSLSANAARQLVFKARNSLVETAAGREELCDSVRETLSANDRRRLRSRRVRAHLRSCAGCQRFAFALKLRPRELEALVPPLPPAAAAAALAAIVGEGHGGAVVAPSREGRGRRLAVALAALLLLAGTAVAATTTGLFNGGGGGESSKRAATPATTPPASAPAAGTSHRRAHRPHARRHRRASAAHRRRAVPVAGRAGAPAAAPTPATSPAISGYAGPSGEIQTLAGARAARGLAGTSGSASCAGRSSGGGSGGAGSGAGGSQPGGAGAKAGCSQGGGGGLPFTGLEIGAMAAAALLLLLTGFALRRATRPEAPPG